MSGSERLPIKRRLLLLTVAGAAGGALFVPFVLANSSASAPVVFTAFTLGSALVTALSAWGGLRWADRAELPMPLLRKWESGLPTRPEMSKRTIGLPLLIGGIVGLVAALVANGIGVPPNPGSFSVRVATTLFAAVVPEVLVHLLIMSGLVLLTRRVWVAIILSAAVFVLLFHGDPPEGARAMTAFVVSLNFGLGVLTGWIFSRWGFVAAMLAHGAAHFIVLGIN